MRLLPVGGGNFVSAEQVLAVVSPDAAPVRRMVAAARENGRLIDATCGRKTRAVLVSVSDHVILSGMTVEQLAKETKEET